MQRMFPVFTAAQIMTPRAEWVCWETDSPRDLVLDENGKLRFDVIPVTAAGKVVGLLTNTSFTVQPLTLEWCLTHDVSIDRLIAFFIERGKPACFLLREDDFAGLVTPADLNKTAARTALYLRLAELEMRLAAFIRSLGMSEEEVLAKVSEDRREEVKRNQAELRDKNVDISVFEMLYLSDIFNVIAKNESALQTLGFSSRKDFKRATSGLNDLRNRVMHPARPVLRNVEDELRTLHDRIVRMEGLLVKLEETSTPLG
ncbi:MAG: hypothetical protein GXP39_10760 [Chloroflexi bacterium]|nr:hypothetical protein [Chloroflexota bacterium]